MEEKSTNIAKENISIIIPSYNGKELLRKNLPILLKAIRPNDEIIIIDDASIDGSGEFIKNNYPQARLVQLKKNQGCIVALNYGIRESNNNLIYLLNNDVEVSQNFIDPLLRHFQKESTFAVNSREISPDIDINFDVLTTVKFKFGLFWYCYEKVPRLKKAVPVFFAHGAHTMIDREKFLSLGGFDELYRPMYWEGWDISYRARKLGYDIIYEPQSEVYHHKKATLSKILSERDIQVLQWRNHFLFVWKNIFSRRFLIEHIFFAFIYLVVAPFTGKSFLYKPLFQALRRLPEALEARRRAYHSAKYIFTDKELISKFSSKSVRAFL